VRAETWDGPSYQTCRNAAAITDAFEPSRQRDGLSFKHHAEVAALPAAEADALLDWAEEAVAGVLVCSFSCCQRNHRLCPLCPGSRPAKADPPWTSVRL